MERSTADFLTMKVRLTHIDGRLPNLALMRLARYHRDRGDEVHLSYDLTPGLFEPTYDVVYGSSIFLFSVPRLQLFRANFPDAIIGGTGTENWTTLEDLIPEIPDRYDYSIYPNFDASLGFMQRGCRLKCPFCVVPRKEGAPVYNMSIADIYRGEPYPRHLHLLDNDFFSVPEWERAIEDIIEGGFKVCLTQGINVRMITEKAAAALARIDYRGNDFKAKRIYTAWDNLKQENVFFRGMDRLEAAGVPPGHIMAYMLIGYDPKETWERILYRFEKIRDRGILPYPMVYDQERKDLKAFQRWVVRRYYELVSWDEYCKNKKVQLR